MNRNVDGSHLGGQRQNHGAALGLEGFEWGYTAMADEDFKWFVIAFNRLAELAHAKV